MVASRGQFVKATPTGPQRNLTAVAVTWDEFTQNTTAHGVRYIFGKGMLMRRCIWSICFLTTVGIFAYQVFQRSRDFLEYNTNVDIEVVFRHEIPFPSVMICNQNTYRLTAAHERGVYLLMHDLYSFKDITESEIIATHGNIAQQKLSAVIRETAHRAEDFIVGCTWRGEECDIQEDFKPVHTDYGLCFAFNGYENGSRYRADDSGPTNGLSLTLNVEYYEYMIGKRSSIGVQMLLYSREETPQMDTAGFSLAPSTHTYVRVARTEEEYLERPYGVCATHAVPKTTCNAEGKYAEQMEQCGCVSAFSYYDENSTTTDICTLTAEHFCIRPRDKAPKRTINSRETDGKSRGNGRGDDEDKCPLPCHRTVYSHGLSYASLAQHNIRDILLSHVADGAVTEAKLTSRLQRAREVLYRQDPKVAPNLQKKQSDVTRAFDTLLSNLEQATFFLGSPGQLGALYGVADLVTSGSSALNADIQTMTSLQYRQENAHKFKMYEPFDTYLSTLGPDVLALVEQYPICLPLVNNSREPCQQEMHSDLISRVLDGIRIPPSAAISKQLRGVNSWVPVAILNLKMKDYNSLMESSFTDTGVDLTSISEHNLCLEQMTEYAVALNASEDLLSASKIFFEDDADILAKKRRLEEILQRTDFEAVIRSLVFQPKRRFCEWTTQNVEEERNKIRNVAHLFNDAEKKLDILQNIYLVMYQYMIKAATVAKEKLKPYIDKIDAYMREDIHLLHLTDHWISIDDHLDSLESPIKSSVGVADAFARAISFRDDLTIAFDGLWDIRIPILNYSTLYNTSTWKTLVGNSNVSEIVTERENIEKQIYWPPNFSIIIDTLSAPYISYPKDTMESVFKSYENFGHVLRKLRHVYEEFSSSVMVDEKFYRENFVKVDIFYSELKYQRVSQRRSFELLSLLSEVGGFLGLLLGASVLTMCEVFDFLAMHLVARVIDWQNSSQSSRLPKIVVVRPKVSPAANVPE